MNLVCESSKATNDLDAYLFKLFISHLLYIYFKVHIGGDYAF